ncbi:MAG: antitoxin VbhA family protein [Dysgonamonadaceae bacterium]|jgi:hypothetical protein|nr:antitoxin VbhA family protein [Dysgonamonadaceae bacterium]
MTKQTAWNYALGLIQVDGLSPTPEFVELANKEIRGEITLEDIEKRLNKRYRMK